LGAYAICGNSEGVVKDQIDCQVASGAHYRFALFKDGRPLSPMGGNYLFVRETDDGTQVLYCAEADNLSVHARERWAEAEQRHGATALYTRLNVSSGVRKRENAELLEAYSPPMNAAEHRRAG
jgi:hypothetical protein